MPSAIAPIKPAAKKTLVLVIMASPHFWPLCESSSELFLAFTDPAIAWELCRNNHAARPPLPAAVVKLPRSKSDFL
jgi:hypothetical protein